VPVFGEYEAIGEPVAVTQASDHISTVWSARKIVARDDRRYAIKQFAFRRSRDFEGQSEDNLEADHSLKFIESVKQLKKVQNDKGRGIAPIYAFGTSETGAWYVTDFCERGSLKTWITRRGGVDDASLRHIVHSVAIGCLSLKRSCNRSHGNLKVSNVLLMGKPQSLRKTPILIVDCASTPPAQASQLVSGGRNPFEAKDLRAIGEIIIQLVEGRIIESSFDYNYPIAPSPSWDSFGKSAESWRELCNRLLDPQLSVDKVNLENLERKFQPNPIVANMPAMLAGAGLIGLVAGTLYFVLRETPPTITQQPKDTISEFGSNADYTVVAGGGKLKYQWWKDGNVIAGATSSSFGILSVQNNDNGRYYVVVTNHAGAITSRKAQLTVTPAELTVTAHDANRALRENNPPLTGEISGLRPGDDITATYRTSASINSPIGSYDILPALNDPGNRLHNYTVITNKGTLTITIAGANELMLTTRNKSRAYGEPNPPLTGEISGLREGDDIAATYRTPASTSSPIGSYEIVPVLNDLGNKLHNYTVITNKGTLTVTPARLTVMAHDTNRAYGESNPPLNGEISGLRPGDGITATFNTTARVNTAVGNYDIVPALNDPDNKLHNYTVITNRGTLTVTPADLTVTAHDTNCAYGENNPPLTGEISGLRPGDDITATYHISASTNSPSGSYDIVPTLNDPGNKLKNYTVITIKGTLTVTNAPPSGPPAPPPPPNFEVSGLNFKWVSNLRNGKGAYVEETEMSQAQYNSLAGQYGLTPFKNTLTGTISDTNDPVNITYEGASQLLVALNHAPLQSQLQKKFELPSRQDFLIFSGVNDKTTNSNPSYNVLDNDGLFSSLKANVNEPAARAVGEGSPNKFGLFNVLGDSWEWCNDGSAAGFEFDSKGGSLFRDQKFLKGQYVGVRLLLVPDQ
jgi:hypothetical protein